MAHGPADNWQSLHNLPDGTILVDGEGRARQIEHHRDGETWLNLISDEYTFIVRRTPNGKGELFEMYEPPAGPLIEVWRPSTPTTTEQEHHGR